MLSQLGPLFKTHLRQAEKSDARLEIRRDEQNGQNKKQHFEQDGEQDSGFWEDSTAVSIEALKTFLAELLRSRGDAGPAAVTGTPPAQEAATKHLEPLNTRTAMAVKAYGHTAAQAGPASPPSAPQEPDEASAIDLADLLASDDIRTIHALIVELESLSRKGVQTLQIEKADSFLQALVQAVRLEKTKG